MLDYTEKLEKRREKRLLFATHREAEETPELLQDYFRISNLIVFHSFH